MNLTIDEKEKLYNKALKIYNEIKEIKIRKDIEIYIHEKYHNNDKFSNRGFKYYSSGSICIFGVDIGSFLEELNNYIQFKKYNGEEYINGKSVSFIYYNDVNSLLDFVLNGNYILNAVKSKNNETLEEINNLLN